MDYLSEIRWRRVSTAAVGVILVTSLLIFLVITGYSVYLSIQARGAPDAAMIEGFSANATPWLGAIGGVVFALVGGWWTGRGIETSKPLNGLFVGVVVVVVSLLISRFSVSIFDIVEYVLTLLASWFGGRMSQ